MTYDEFWFSEPERARYYRRADEIRKRRVNEQMWWNGLYTAEALAATVGNMFSKSKYEYPSEPKPITKDEIEERRVREEKKRIESIKSRFTAHALKMNAERGMRS